MESRTLSLRYRPRACRTGTAFRCARDEPHAVTADHKMTRDTRGTIKGEASAADRSGFKKGVDRPIYFRHASDRQRTRTYAQCHKATTYTRA